MQGSSGDADTENRLVDTVGEEWGRVEKATLKYIHYRLENRKPVGIGCMMQGAQICCSVTT